MRNERNHAKKSIVPFRILKSIGPVVLKQVTFSSLREEICSGEERLLLKNTLNFYCLFIQHIKSCTMRLVWKGKSTVHKNKLL